MVWEQPRDVKMIGYDAFFEFYGREDGILALDVNAEYCIGLNVQQVNDLITALQKWVDDNSNNTQRYHDKTQINDNF